MNTYFKFLFVLIGSVSFAQSDIEPLKKQLQIGLSFQGPDVTFQLPVAEKFLLSAGVGGGLTNIVKNDWEEEIGLSLKKDRLFSPFTRLSARYVYNRAKRKSKERSLINNAGNYIAFQNKFSFGGHYGTVMINELHWGTQLPLGRDIVFETHIGLGRLENIDYKHVKIFPTIGFRFSYVIF